MGGENESGRSTTQDWNNHQYSHPPQEEDQIEEQIPE
jgi:hypothetical protein